MFNECKFQYKHNYDKIKENEVNTWTIIYLKLLLRIGIFFKFTLKSMDQFVKFLVSYSNSFIAVKRILSLNTVYTLIPD